MIASFKKTKEGPGILASIEASFPWGAFNILKDLLFRFYAFRGAALEDVDFDNHQTKKDRFVWSLALIHEGRLYGRINITYLNEQRNVDGREWKSFNFWIYFYVTNNEVIQIKERNRFLEFKKNAR